MSKVYDWKLNSGGGGLPLLPIFAPVTEDVYNITFRPTHGPVGSYFMADSGNNERYKCRIVRMDMQQGGLQVGEKVWYTGITPCVHGTVLSFDYDPGTDPYTWAGWGLYPMGEATTGYILCIATP
jgi:hypothetical protein